MSDSTPNQSGGDSRPVKQFRRSRARRIGDSVNSVFVRAGVVPRTYVLTTKGRKTGRWRSNPATVVVLDGKRWLVAPYGVVSWVHNARADDRVRLSRRFDTSEYKVREVSAEEAGPVLKQYLVIAPVPRPYFRATVDSPVEEFIAEADQHPVFELMPLS